MAIKSMSKMWAALQAVTHDSAGRERSVNHLNEWGGFSKRLQIPVFTAWEDQTAFDKVSKMVTALVCSRAWTSAIGVNNQERWIAHAEKSNGGKAAFFIIHAVDTKADPRKVSSIEDKAVFIGNIIREGERTYIKGIKTPL